MERRTENRESSRRERETERYRHRQTDKERERRVNSGAAPVTKTTKQSNKIAILWRNLDCTAIEASLIST